MSSERPRLSEKKQERVAVDVTREDREGLVAVQIARHSPKRLGLHSWQYGTWKYCADCWASIPHATIELDLDKLTVFRFDSNSDAIVGSVS